MTYSPSSDVVRRAITWIWVFGLGFAAHESPSFGQGTLQPIHITFDGPPLQAPGTATYVQQYYESGMWFRPLGVVGPGNGFVRQGGSFTPAPENGTTYLQGSLGDSLVFSFLDDYAFDLVSLDLAEYSTVFPIPFTLPLVGYRADGSTVSGSFTTDGIIDGTGPLADFETFTFGPEFSNLLRFEIPTYGWSLDNLKLIRVVPEPNSMALFLFGVLFVGLRRSKRIYPKEHDKSRQWSDLD